MPIILIHSMKRFGYLATFLSSVIIFLSLSLGCNQNSEEFESLVKKIPNPKISKNSWILDEANILSNADEINAIIANYEAETTVEIAVVILPSIESFVPKDFAVALFNEWGIGKKKKDNGILILHVLDQRRIEIEVGYGLEGDLPDVTVKRIIEQYTIPAFKKEEFANGHFLTVTAIINQLKNPSLAIEDLVSASESENTEETQISPATMDRTDLYDYQGKTYSQLSEDEKKRLELTIEKFNSTSNYFLDDEENRLWSEKIALEQELDDAYVLKIKTRIFLGLILTLLFLISLQLIFVILFPTPSFNYHLVKNLSYPLFYGILAIPWILLVFVITHFFTDEGIPISAFLSIFSFVIFNLVGGNEYRIKLLAPILMYIRNKPRNCPTCKHRLHKLSEKEDDRHLQKGQIWEERMQSIDYDVWKCDTCNTTTILNFPKIDPDYIYKGTSFRKVKKCPECKYETFVHKSSDVLRYATYDHSGKVEVNRVCKHCNHKETEFEIIPQKQKSSSGSGGGSSSSSSSGSFGGGSSGGGGSGGSY
ncbi:MAG: TPM domain-containing protein [Leptospira sp.]|nr:TPM domain-containing protein [Leptospira sp.]